jgi:hypothetical protein
MMKIVATRRIFIMFTILLVMSLFVSGRAFAWTISRDFEGGAVGNVATGSAGYFWVNSSNMKFTNTQAHSGSISSSAYFQIGSADTTGATFEGNGATVSEGGEVWFREYLYFPAGFIFSSAPVQKVFRISTTSGYLSVYNINGNIAMSNEPSVYAGYDEPGTQASSNAAFSTGKWQCIEMYVKLNHSLDQGIFRIWKDGILILENKHYPTLANSSAQVNDIFTQFNYWNGGSPANQTAYVDDIVITNVAPSAKDAAGNAMIGPTNWTVSASLQSPSGLRVTAN